MLHKVGSFKNDKPIGEFKYYYNTGKIQAKMTHDGNQSYSIMYYNSGTPKAVGKYVNQKKDSTWSYYDDEGYKKATEYYTNGQKNRIWYIYYPDGKIAEETEYLNDFEQGIWNKYWPSGKKKMTATYDKGGLEGKAVYFNSVGKRSVSGYYFANNNAKYFGLGKISSDQVIDYAKRRNITIEKAKKWLNPNINDV